MKKFNFFLGNVEVGTNNINELREYVAEISDNTEGKEYSKYLSNFLYDVESAYQEYHGLEPDDFSIIHLEDGYIPTEK